MQETSESTDASPSCAVTMCEFEDNENERLLPVCSKGHHMHKGCLKNFFRTTEDPRCPVCRDDTLCMYKELVIDNPHEYTPPTPERYTNDQITEILGDDGVSLDSLLDDQVLTGIVSVLVEEGNRRMVRNSMTRSPFLRGPPATGAQLVWPRSRYADNHRLPIQSRMTHRRHVNDPRARSGLSVFEVD